MGFINQINVILFFLYLNFNTRFLPLTPTYHLGIKFLHAVRHMNNSVSGGIITLNALTYRFCHYSWPGCGDN